ncbi:hypothetical protein SRHO_G00310020 [Serrasalmus rhombeus]
MKYLLLQILSGHQPPPHTPWPGLTLASALLFTAAITALLCKRSPKRRQSPESNLQQHHNGMQILYSVMLQEREQNSCRSSTFTVVEFTQLSPVL